MDQTQKPISDQIAENTDLSKQYQDILNQYSKELQGDNQTDPTPPVSTPAPTPTPTNPPETPVSLPPVPPMVNASVTPAPSTSSAQPKSIFKYFFFLSLLVFLGVFGTIVYTMISSQANPTNITMSTPSPTPALDDNISTTGKFCEINDKKVAHGESFTAADGCNTCTCGDDLTITCTEKDCSATSLVTPAVTEAVKPTAPIEISVVDPIKSILESINKQLKTNYQATTIDKGKKWSVNLSKTSNKANILIIKRAITSYGLAFQEDLSGEAGSDWKETYVKTADTCTLEMMQGVFTLSCFN